jgi:hypothetical protein
MANRTAHSAADVQWRSIRITISGPLDRAYMHVQVIGKKGITTEWRQDLLTVPLEGINVQAANNVTEALTAARDALSGLLGRTDAH